MTPDELTPLAVSKALAIAQWMFPGGRREKSEWLVPIEGSTDGYPVLSINVGLRAGHWKDLVTQETGADLFELYALQFDVSREAAQRAIAEKLGVTLDETPLKHERSVCEIAQVAQEPPATPSAALPTPASNGSEPHPADLDAPPPKPRAKAAAIRLLPSAPETEKGLLSCFLLNADYTYELCVKAGISPRHFHTPAHAEIYDHLFFLRGERMECDIVTLTRHFADAGRLDAVGGAAYLAELYTAPGVTQLASYIEILEEKLAARQLIHLTDNINNRAYDVRSSEEFRELLAEFKTEAGALTIERSQGGLPPIDDGADLVENLPAETPEVVCGVLRMGWKAMLAGGSKSYKTWSLADLAVSVASGSPWWGFETMKGKVLYIQMENQKAGFSRRLKRICEARGIHLKRGELQVWNLRRHTGNPERLLAAVIAKARDAGVSLIILDPFYKLAAGKQENEVGAMAELLAYFDVMAEETGAAVLYGHHFSKGSQSGKESIDRASGSGVFARDADTILTLTPHETADAYTVEPILREFPPVVPFVLRWQFPLMLRDGAGLDPAKLKQPATGRKATYSESDIIDVLKKTGGMKTLEWKKACMEEGVTHSTFFRLRRMAIASKKVTESKLEKDQWLAA